MTNGNDLIVASRTNNVELLKTFVAEPHRSIIKKFKFLTGDDKQ